MFFFHSGKALLDVFTVAHICYLVTMSYSLRIVSVAGFIVFNFVVSVDVVKDL